MQHRIAPWSLLICLALSMLSCQKDLSEQMDDLKDTVGGANNSATNGPRLTYASNLFFLRNQSAPYLVLPTSRPNGAGYFKANPQGLAIDSITGQININQSESGLRYKVYFISPTGNAIDSFKLVVSGIDYADSIYRIRRTLNAYDTAFPIYNAQIGQKLPCGDQDIDDDGDLDDDDNGCVFDETDLNDDGNDDIAGVNQDKLLVDIKKGFIDVEASYEAGVFGPNPANGLSKDFTCYYRLADASNRALQKITVRLYHYRTINDVPQWLINEINNRKTTEAEANRRWISGSGQTDGFNERFSWASFGPVRPPLIVIVAQ